MCVLFYEIIITYNHLTHHTTLGSLVSHRLVQKIKKDDTIITRMIQGKDLGEKKEIITSPL